MKRVFVLLSAVMIATACERRERFAAPDTSSAPATPPVPERSAYLSVSDLSPEAGDTVVVAGTVRLGDKLSLGSFRVRLGFDSTRLRFLDDVTNGEMLRVVNPQPGNVIVVGASSSGSSDGKLFAFRFRIDDPVGINSLVLRIDELNDVEFKDQKETVTRASALVADRSLSRGAESRASAQRESSARPNGAGSASRTVGGSSQPVIDSISPRSGQLENERMTDVAIYGKGFAPRGNLVHFGGVVIDNLMSEAGGTVIRFSAPSIRIQESTVPILVEHDGVRSNAVTFAVRRRE